MFQLELVDVIKANLETTLPRNVINGDTIFGGVGGRRIGTISYRDFPTIVVNNTGNVVYQIDSLGGAILNQQKVVLSALDPQFFDKLVTAVMEVVKLNRERYSKRKSLYQSAAKARKRAKKVRR